MQHIHPTAIIHPDAKLAPFVKVDAYAIINQHVSIDEGTHIGAFTIIEGNTIIGKNNNIGHHSLIGGKPQDMKYNNEETKLIIGDNNTIREFVTIHTGTIQDKAVTRVGNNNWIMSYVHIAHDCILGDYIILSNNAQLAGHVQIQDYAIIGGMTGVHQFVRIGTHAMIGGASSLVQDVPPYVMAAGQKATPHGINSTGLSRRGFNLEQISKIKHMYKILYREGLSLEEAKLNLASYLQDNLEYNQQNSLSVFIDFIISSERGIIR